jgi:hypothetical protein
MYISTANYCTTSGKLAKCKFCRTELSTRKKKLCISFIMLTLHFLSFLLILFYLDTNNFLRTNCAPI